MAAVVHHLPTTPTPKRGRPPKWVGDKPKPTPCTLEFDDIVKRVQEIAADRKAWAEAKDAVRARARADRALRASDRLVLDFLLDKVNRRLGYDFHTIAQMSEECCKPYRTIQNGIKGLVDWGYIVRKEFPAKRRNASRPYRTAIAALVVPSSGNGAPKKPGTAHQTMQNETPNNAFYGTPRVVP